MQDIFSYNLFPCPCQFGLGMIMLIKLRINSMTRSLEGMGISSYMQTNISLFVQSYMAH